MADKKTKAKSAGAKKDKTELAASTKSTAKVSTNSSKKATKLSKTDKTVKKPRAKSGSRKIWKPFHILGLIFWPRFIRNSFKELRQVTWLSFKGSIALTVAVLFFAVIFVVFIGLIDIGLDRVFKALFLK